MNKSVKKGIRLLVNNLSEMGVSIKADDVHYSIMNAEEWIYIDAGLLGIGYLSGIQFGIYVDANREEFFTDTSMLSKQDRLRAKELLLLFKNAYHDIVHNIYDELSIKE